MTENDWAAFNTVRRCHICKKDLVRCDESDEAEVLNPTPGEYCGKAHKYKRSPECGQYTCFGFEMKCLYTDEKGNRIEIKTKKRNKITKKWYLEENPDESNCIHCKGPLMREEFRDAVRDHCHITGEYRGAARNACNLKLKIYPKSVIIPVICHNLKNYDAHHIMREIGKVTGELKYIPNNMEKYITFSLGKLRFIDSCQHLLTELEKLVASKSKNSFHITERYLQDEEKLKLLLRKGVCPYEYMDAFERFNETSLPPKEAFYSTLKMEEITDKNYEHAKRVWDECGLKTMGDDHDVYLVMDTLLLADVCEGYRTTAF